MAKKANPLPLLFIIITGWLINPPRSLSHPSLGIDLSLARDLTLIEAYNRHPDSYQAQRLAAFGLPVEKDPVLLLFIYLPATPDSKSLTELETEVEKLYPYTWLPPVGIHPYGCMLAKVRASRVHGLLKEGKIVRAASARRQLEPLNDSTAYYSGVTAAREMEPPLTGRGVRLTVIDSGFQLDHPDLPAPAATMDYADYPDTNADVTDRRSGHGTHTAGTMFGSGELSEGRWQGMAPEASPIYLKVGNDTTSSASTAAVVGAIRATASWCEADIANMSYGGSDGVNDGTTPEDQAVDWAVSQGTSLFVSAGNSANAKIHYSAVLSAGQTSAPVQVIIKYAPRFTVWTFSLAWFDGPDTSLHTHLSAGLFDADNQPLAMDSTEQTCTPRGSESLMYLPEDYLPLDSTVYTIRVVNRSEQELRFHLEIFSKHNWVRFIGFDPHYTVLTPSVADSCISVGAYTTRCSWRDWQGNDHLDAVTIGDLTNFSSLGPRLDGIIKPNITAPGRRTISCRNTDVVQLDGNSRELIVSNNGQSGEPADYFVAMGTSMSSPAAAGAAALVLEAHPELSPAQLRERLYRGARVDTLTGAVPNDRWGYGKVDIQQALTAPENSIRENLPQEFALRSVFPNPFNETAQLEFQTLITSPLQLEVYDLRGRLIVQQKIEIANSGIHHLIVPFSSVDNAAGIYIIRLRQNSETAVIKAVMVK